MSCGDSFFSRPNETPEEEAQRVKELLELAEKHKQVFDLRPYVPKRKAIDLDLHSNHAGGIFDNDRVNDDGKINR